MHYVQIIDPGISAAEPPLTYPPWDEGINLNIFVVNSSSLPFIGKVRFMKALLFSLFVLEASLTCISINVTLRVRWKEMNSGWCIEVGPHKGVAMNMKNECRDLFVQMKKLDVEITTQ